MTEPEDEAARLAAVRELVIRRTGEGSVDTSVMPLDAYVSILGEISECQAAVTFWSKRLERLKAGLTALMGDAHEGTINGEAAVFYAPVNRFNVTEFKKKHPNMARAYMHTVSHEELDVEALKLSRPELYAEFQVRPLRIIYEPPGTPKVGGPS